MTESSRVPADAIKLAEAAFLNLPDGAQFRERLKVLPEYGEPVVVPPAEVAEQMLAAALPAIHAEIRERLEARLTLTFGFGADREESFLEGRKRFYEETMTILAQELGEQHGD